MRCNGKDRPWTEGGGECAGKGETVGLLLDLDRNMLSVYHQSHASWDDATGSSMPSVHCVGKVSCV